MERPVLHFQQLEPCLPPFSDIRERSKYRGSSATLDGVDLHLHNGFFGAVYRKFDPVGLIPGH